MSFSQGLQGGASLANALQPEISAEDIRLAKNNQKANQLLDLRAAILNYMWQKAADEDWHGVMDAAADLREIDAKLSVLRS